MIAVFSRSKREFDNIFVQKTKGIFIYTNSIEDIRGRDFVGVLEIAGWWHTDNIIYRKKDEALIELKRKCPNLFN